MNRHRRLPVLLSGVFVLSACAELPEVTTGVCGNKVVESGEQCDTFSAYGEQTRCGEPTHPHACAYVCDLDSVCPSGWSCGADSRCRRAVGQFEPEARYDFSATTVDVGDLDGDGNLDLIGIDRDRLTLTYGRFDGTFTDAEAVQSRLPTGRATMVDFDGDGRHDILVPATDGLLVWLAREDQTVVPRAYDAPIASGHPTSIRFVVLREPNNLFGEDDVLLIADGFATVSNHSIALPPDVTAEALSASLPMADIDRPRDGRREVALAIDGQRRIDLYRIANDATGAAFPEVAATLALPAPLNGSVHFADLDGDDRVDLVASVTTGVVVAFGAIGGDGFAPFCSLNLPSLGVPAPILAVDDLTGDGLADFVFDNGIAVNVTRTRPFCSLPTSYAYTNASVAGSWSEAVVGDFNRDGRRDVAVSVPSDNRIDILFSTGMLLFNRRSVLLTAEAHRLVAADFDGDFSDDLAFVSARDAALGDEVSVVFSELENVPADPVIVGRFGTITDIQPALLFTSVETLDGRIDLFVVSRSVAAPDEWSLATLQGSSARRLFAPLSFAALNPPGAVVGGVAGHFCGCVGDCEEGRKDVAVVYGSALRTEVFIAKQQASEPPGDVDVITAHHFGVDLSDRARFDFGCALWSAGDWNGDGLDEVFAFDSVDSSCGGRSPRSSSLAVFDFSSATSCTSGPSRAFVAVDGARGVVRSGLVDIDGDGDLDLYAVFAGVDGEGGRIVVFVNDGRAIQDSSMIAVPAPPGATAIDATWVQLDDRPSLELVVRAQFPDGARAFFHQLEGLEFGARQTLELRIGDGPGAVVGGDFDRNGVQDLVFTDRGGFEVFLGVDGGRP